MLDSHIVAKLDLMLLNLQSTIYIYMSIYIILHRQQGGQISNKNTRFEL